MVTARSFFSGRPGWVRAEAVRQRLLGQADDLGHALRRNRRLAGRTGLVAQQADDALVHEPLLPALDTGPGLVGLGHDRRGTQALDARKNNTRPPDALLRALGVRDDRAQSLTVTGRYGEGISLRMRQTRTPQQGIPKRTLLN